MMETRKPPRCPGCGQFVSGTRKHRHTTPKRTGDRERTAARLVNDGVGAAEARRRAGLAPLPRYLTYRPRNRIAAALGSDAGARTAAKARQLVPKRRRGR